MATIYLALACTDYEGATAIKAFSSKADADRFIQACEEHQRFKPEWSGANDGSPESDAAFDTWAKRDDTWRAQHPAGPSLAGYDGYVVCDIELVQALAAPLAGGGA